jgi:membrane fusion protein, multidrug efflux system
MRRPVTSRSLIRRIVVALACVAVAVTAYAFWPFAAPAPQRQPGGRGGEGRPVPVMTAAVVQKDVPIYLDALGTVQAYNTVTVRSRIDGELVEVLFKEGQDVRAGDVLAQIDPRTYRAQYEQAVATRDRDAAQLEGARRDLQRYVGLGDRVTGQSVDTQRALVKQLEATVRADQAAAENARTMLSYTVITAPIDGRAGIRQIDQGNVVHAGDTTGLVTLTQVQPIAVIFTLPQQDLQAIIRHQSEVEKLTVLATQPDNKTVIDQGKLELFDNQIDQTTGTIRLKAVMPNPERRLWPGAFVNVRLLLTTRQGGLVIPAPAVQRGPQGPYAFVVRPDHTAEMRTITVAAVEGDQALVEAGLQPGETVVTDGVAKLQNGSRVAVPDGTAPPTGGAEPERKGRRKGGEARSGEAKTGEAKTGEAKTGEARQP